MSASSSLHLSKFFSELLAITLPVKGVHYNVPIGELSWKEWMVQIFSTLGILHRKVLMVTYWAVWYTRNQESFSMKFISGIICRDSDGCVLAACSTPHWFVADPFQAEALACLVVVKFARDLGFTWVIVECDSLTVIVKCQSELIDVSLISLVIANIKDASKVFESINFGFVHREANTVAHTLAQEGKSYNSLMYWIEEAPPPPKKKIACSSEGS
ncbi:hypothetical protein V6N13_037568 [Hibiscus sabdariffa]